MEARSISLSNGFAGQIPLPLITTPSTSSGSAEEINIWNLQRILKYIHWMSLSNYCFFQSLKGIVELRKKLMSSTFTHPHAIPNLHFFLLEDILQKARVQITSGNIDFYCIWTEIKVSKYNLFVWHISQIKITKCFTK